MKTETELMIDNITKLREEYKKKFGVSVFSLSMPCVYNFNLSVEQLNVIMEHIVKTGESIYDGYIKYIIKRPLTVNDVIVHTKSKEIKRK